MTVTFQIHSPFSTGIQEDYTECSLLFLHAEQDSLHTDTVLWLIRLRGINSNQVIPPSMVVPMTSIVKEAWKQPTALSKLQVSNYSPSHTELNIFWNAVIYNSDNDDGYLHRIH